MTFWYIIHVLLLLEYLYISEVTAVFSGENRNGVTCVEYNKILPTGTCIKYFQHKQIAQTKRTAVKRNRKLADFYETYIPMYSLYQGNKESVMHMLNTYLLEYCDRNKDKLKSLMDSLNLPSGSQLERCTNDIKKFICKISHPICMSSMSSKIVLALPCRDECEKNLNTPSCSFVKPLFEFVHRVSQLCPKLLYQTRKWINIANCKRFPKGEEYCLVKESNTQMGNKIKSGIESLNRESDNPVKTNAVKIRKGEEDTLQCVSYKSVVPSGVCLKFFVNSIVAQTTEHLREIDNNIGRIYMLLGTVLLNSLETEDSAKANNIWSWVMDKITLTCSNITKVYDLKRNFTKAFKTRDIRECLQGKAWFFCHIYHPKCVSSYGKSKTSPVCRETCKSIWDAPSCSFVRDLYKLYKEINKICTVPYGEHIDNLFNCEKYPSLDMKHIEKCQLGNSTDLRSTSSCYHGNGFNYNGSENTADGHKCAMWGSDPYLNSEMYPTLKNNYCRNPQGYAEKPWCYTNIKTKTWAYCNVEMCTGVTTTTYPNYVNIVIISLVILMATGFVIYLYRKKEKKMLKEYRGIHDRPDINYVQVTH